MKFTDIVQAKKKVKSILGIGFLVFFLNGCVTTVSQAGNTVKCRQAEEAVNLAQKQYDDAFEGFANKPTDESTKKSVPATVQSLQETQEKAFEMCNSVN